MPIRATMMLCDAAQAVDGKLYILGGGWNTIGADPAPTAIAMYVEIPWDMTNMKHAWRLELLDADNQPVQVPTPAGERPLVVEGELEVGRPPGVTPGIGLGVPLAINVGPIALGSGQRYVWRLSIRGESNDNWRLPFSTRAAGAAPAPQPPGD